jgi:hypothetical protein
MHVKRHMRTASAFTKSVLLHEHQAATRQVGN